MNTKMRVYMVFKILCILVHLLVNIGGKGAISIINIVIIIVIIIIIYYYYYYCYY